MTKRSLKTQFVIVAILYAGLFALAVFLQSFDDSPKSPYYNTLKDFLPVLLAVPAVWLGYCLQRRNSYMHQLRDLWSKIVEAVQGAISCVQSDLTNKEDSKKAIIKMKIVIDEIRGVFKNLGENWHPTGLYPFEPLKQIHDSIDAAIKKETFSEEEKKRLLEEILSNWKLVRSEILKEFDRDEPTHFSSYYVDYWKARDGDWKSIGGRFVYLPQAPLRYKIIYWFRKNG